MYEKTVMFTGGCGAIGSEVINRLKGQHPQTLFVNLDALTYAGKAEHIEPPFDNYVLVHGNICDVECVANVLECYKPQVIVHLAAETHVDNSFGNSFQFTMTNVYGTHVLLECTKQYIANGNAFERFIHMSTDEVYGSVSDDEEARKEDALYAPSNPYAATKVGAEMICMSYQKSFNVPLIIIRCNNALSKYQNNEKLIPKVISSIMKGDKVPVHGQGRSKRTFIHAYDIADAIWLIMEQGALGKVYNIGTDHEYSVLEVIDKIVSIMRPEVEDIKECIEFVPDRPFQDYRYFIDTMQLRELGWTEKVGFHDAVATIIEAAVVGHTV
jgi:dTDP-glucose 4,6-dehydratase